MQVFFQNYAWGIGVSSLNPLDALLEQALEIFENLPEDDGSFIGIVNEKNMRIQFSKYDRFNWLLDIPMINKKGTYQMFLPKEKCRSLISKVFSGLDPLKIKGLSFERFV